MRLQIKITRDINWICLFLLLLKIMGVNSKLFFILSGIYLFSLVLKSNKIYIPKMNGLGLYILFIIYGTIIGILMNPLRDVLRDLFYILPTVVWIFIGYYLSKQSLGNSKLLKTLYLYAGLNSMFCFLNFILNQSSSFDSLRIIFGYNVYDVGFILPVMVYEVFLYNKIIFGKKIDICIIIIMTIQIMMSFGRVAIISPLIILCVLLFLELKIRGNSTNAFKFIVKSVVILILLLIILFNIVPNSITDIFANKLLNSFQEIKYTQEIDSTVEAINNWRAYEMKAAINEWKASNILVKMLGEGIGEGTIIEYIPYHWIGIIENNEIPLLHNGFYTLLMKGGIFAVFSLIWMYVGNILKGLNVMKRYRKDRKSAIILIAISCGAIANTYVVLGPIQQGVFLSWGTLIGCMTYMINKKDDN